MYLDDILVFRPDFVTMLVETSKFSGCSLHIQQPAAPHLYKESFTQLLNAAAFQLQPTVMDFDVSP